MFVNFRRLYDYNNGKMPMGVAQVRALAEAEATPVRVACAGAAL